MMMMIFAQMILKSILVDLFSQPQNSYLTQAVWLHQSDCDENQTDVTTLDNKLSNLTKNEQELFHWNVKSWGRNQFSQTVQKWPLHPDQWYKWRSLRSDQWLLLATFGSNYPSLQISMHKGLLFLYLVMKPFLGLAPCHRETIKQQYCQMGLSSW